jgi:murein DD-endopeptidase MepM/ murein hydrolase activator NlpD
MRAKDLRACAALFLGLAFLGACSLPIKTVPFQPAPTAYYTVPVQKGETLKNIADRWQVREDDLLAVNSLYDPNGTAEGGTIRVPAYGHLRDETAPPKQTAATASPREVISATPGASVPRPAPVEKLPIPEPKPAAQKSKTSESWLSWIMPSTGTPQISERLVWPVKGRVLSPFGANAEGARNDGINISASRGTPVHAAAAGSVTYVGDDLKAYGNLVLVSHDNGFVTAYAHCDKITVKRGDHVAAGQVIALAGATGDVDEPQVHFELRQGSKPVDPEPYFVAAN